MTNQVVKQSKSVSAFLSGDKVAEFLEKELGSKKASFTSNLIAMSDADPKIAECEPAKLMQCAMNATAVGLSLNKNLGHAYIVPYNGVPQFQLGFKGLIQLAVRTGQYKYINATEVREGEIERNKFTGAAKYLGEKEDGKVIGYLALFKLHTGFEYSVYMTEADIEAYALKYSMSYKYDKSKGRMSSKWSDPVERPKMAKKTVLKRLLNSGYAPLSIELESAMSNDNDTVEGSYEDIEHSRGAEVVEAKIVDQSEKKAVKSVNVEDM
jgi:recombination protein RecT